MKYNFLCRVAADTLHINRINFFTTNTFLKKARISNFGLIQNEYLRYKSSDVTGVAFSPLPDAELKIQLYYKAQEIKKRKEKLKEIAQAIWNKEPNVDYSRITMDECKTMYEKHTCRAPSLWEAQQIYR